MSQQKLTLIGSGNIFPIIRCPVLVSLCEPEFPVHRGQECSAKNRKISADWVLDAVALLLQASIVHSFRDALLHALDVTSVV